ncbi:cell wall-active antibiotics response protein [Pseudalkalibacillus hwajinpoensis]|uniref:cell wall-active antibiotics response protein n=1 Tax=Guptibacillus hwajinpoensis TaxID=208199 RepID=UPI001CD65FB6|nr:cell wall-active antibiotics response protein [Pseudalkalibacillus hwajinpoensis]MCA0991895.1 cell wall-active antibiotics response protein [Pseudalkalibacillus hwajinpoensis]
MKRIQTGRFLVATFFVSLGIFLLLINLGIISMEMTEAIVFFYPFLLLLLGVKYLLEALMPSMKRKKWTTGTLLFIVGLLLVLDRFQVIHFTLSSIWKLWPLIFVLIGFKILGQFRKVQGFSLVRDHSYNKPNWEVRSMYDWSFVCDYDFDFSTTLIPEKETVIHLSGFVGDINVILPEDLPFRIEGSAKVLSATIDKHNQDNVGRGQAITYETDDFNDALQRIVFYLDFSVLDLRVDRI